MLTHLSTEKHRAAVNRQSRDSVGPVKPEKVERNARALRAFRVNYGTPEENDAAGAHLDELDMIAETPPMPAWLPEYIPVEDPDPPRIVRAVRGHRPEPCPRCGRADFRTEAGRSWHLSYRPTCQAYIAPQRHKYATLRV